MTILRCFSLGLLPVSQPIPKSMKTSPRFIHFALLFGFTLIQAHAADRFWDGGVANIGTNGDGVSGGTTGTWSTALTNWDQGNGLAHVAWVNANNDTAIFGGT